MESIKKGLENSNERLNQCRICLKPSKTQIKLTKELKDIFWDVTQTELEENEKLSCFFCPNCTNSLKNAHSYRQELIETQEKLLKEISYILPPELHNLNQEKIGFDDICIDDILEQVFQVKNKEDEINYLELFDENLLDTETIPLEEPVEPKKNISNCDVEGSNEEIKGERQYNVHTKLRDRHVVKKKGNSSIEGTEAICQICGVIRAHKASLKAHIDAVHKKLKKYICDHCGYVASIRTLIRVHMKHHHMDQSQRKKYICDKCDFTTFYKNQLRRHENFEHFGLAIACHCGKLFKDKSALQLHNNIVHLKIKNHACHICGKEFFGKIALKNHITMTHVENKTFQFSCDKCGKQFYIKRQLIAHAKYHKNIKFPCTEPGCNKSFITEKSLANHMKIHNGERDITCHLCDRAYYYMKDLQRHLDVAHDQTIYFCPICLFTNNRKDYLGNHIRVAHPHISKEERAKLLAKVNFIKNLV